jgi:hypothetical protein
MPLLLVPSVHKWRAKQGRPGSGLGSWARAALDPRLWGCLAVALLTFSLVHRLWADKADFDYHLFVLLGKGSTGRAGQVPVSIAGQLRLALEAARQIAFSLGWPVCLASAAGLVLAVRERRLRALALLALPAGYYLAFIAPISFARVRFFIPAVLLLAPFAALALWRWLGWARLPRGVAVGVAAMVLAYSVARPICLDLRMQFDSRYHVERWLAEHVPQGRRWYAVGDHPEFNVRSGRRLTWEKLLYAPGKVFRQAPPDFLVVSVTETAGNEEAAALLHDLEAGAWYYGVVYRYHDDPCPWLLDWSHVSTNLATVNPEIVVLRHQPPRGG